MAVKIPKAPKTKEELIKQMQDCMDKRIGVERDMTRILDAVASAGRVATSLQGNSEWKKAARASELLEDLRAQIWDRQQRYEEWWFRLAHIFNSGRLDRRR